MILSLVVGAGVARAAESGKESDERHLGLSVRDDATAKDIGLPHYPGSKPYKDDGEESSSSATVGFSSPLFGLKVVAMKLETPDELDKVAAFYRQALSKYGKVLECTDAEGRGSKAKPSSAGTGGLECDSDEPGAYGIVYKVGTEEKQRVVALKPHGRGTRFSLVYVSVRDDSED